MYIVILLLPKVHLTNTKEVLNPGLLDETESSDECILMVLFVLVLKIVYFLVNET